MKNKRLFPFSAIVGQDDFKLALTLCVIDPTIGGVLAYGDKGTGKTTLVRSLAQLMGDDEQPFPFINLPIGATEDRVLGHVDIEKLINDKKQVVQKGLLAQAHGGILYIDEINLLNDYLMDILLDASSTGSYFLERDGISHTFESSFCLAGTMNPEEGDLRPQLQDRFGLCLDISTPVDPEIRIAITKSRVEFDTNPEVFCERYKENDQVLKSRIIQARTSLSDVEIPEISIAEASKIALEHQVEGMRADILIIKTARAYAALHNRSAIENEDIQKVAPFVLRHRSQKQPNAKPNNGSTPQDDVKKKPRLIL
ncbi:hypothetical protein GCM10009122_17320 [Fulvivirga kasyanovii]|uniref:AAA family ATPase n=1 Tax=Fulvivirga kasyanovii TaxID=396812 RepID=A0ABW9RQN9_9BACT|nr:AAA family ATPase [Fulvivirga kasyanovii]MTI26492.1 AAA family ATPase [Fulvivirga kasyanovii]